MDLWVRSQLKGSLIKVNDLRIMQLDKDGFRALTEEDAKEGWCIITNDDPCVGTYKTKERALEVLDEIQSLLQPKTIYHQEKPVETIQEGCYQLSQKVNMEFQELSTYVYEMPEE